MAKNQLPPATREQRQAWSYYGLPNKSKPGRTNVDTDGQGNQVGEVRYVIGWMADQMVRMGWRVRINGSETWRVTTSNGEVVTSDAEQSDFNSDTHPGKASARLLREIDWDSRTVREVTTNLFVAGEMHYALDQTETWRVVSVIREDRDEIINNSSLTIRCIWPHPADPDAPDAPLFGVLGVLNDMLWLNRLSRSQSANRVGTRGILGIAESWRTATGESGDGFWADLESALSRPMDDPTDVSPVALIGALELVEPKDSGMKGLSWVVPEFPYDDKVDERMEKLVQRLAYGLPIPPEILLGLQAQSKATAFQVEGSTYRAHIEPVALLVAKVATDTLSVLLDMVDELEVVPDPTVILARRHSVSDTFEAFDRGAVNYDYLREVLGIPKNAEMTEKDIALRQRILGTTEVVDGVSDPADEAAREPITAAARAPSEVIEERPSTPESDDDAWLSDALHRVDTQVLYELVGAVPQAVSKARERLGARVRSSKAFKDQIPPSIDNEEIPLRLGRDGLDALGVPSDEVIDAASASLVRWWTKRVVDARNQALSILSEGGVEAEYAIKPEASAEMLSALIRDAVFQENDVPESRLRDVIELAGQ